MVVVDSSVWIDFFSGVQSSGVGVLQQSPQHAEVRIVVPDLVLFEVLRGFRHERHHRQARALMGYSSAHNDRDFDAFVELRGMRAWQH